MKKSVVTILAVAIIGILGIYSKSHPTSATSASSSLGTSSGSTVATNTATTNGSPSTSVSSSSSSSSGYKDGTYTGNGVDTPYGTVQIAVVVSGGKITNVNFLQMPSDMGHSREVTAIAGPILKQETLQAQSSHIDFVSGASSTSQGYMMSLQSALNQAA